MEKIEGFCRRGSDFVNNAEWMVGFAVAFIPQYNLADTKPAPKNSLFLGQIFSECNFIMLWHKDSLKSLCVFL